MIICLVNQLLGWNQLPDSYISLPFGGSSLSTSPNTSTLSNPSPCSVAMSCIGWFVGVQGLTDNTSLNGKRGEIIGFHNSERWRVNIFGYGEIAAKNENIYVLDQNWVSATKAKRFDQRGMMEHFGAPGLLKDNLAPPPLIDFTHAKPPPFTSILTFWGPRVFDFMQHRAETSLSQKSGYLASYFRHQSHHRLAMVLCDGTKPMQLTPLTQMDPGSIWWPCLCEPTEDPFVFSCYCQAQALCGSRPWPTHVMRIAFLDVAPQIPMAPSSVIIEELPEADAQPQLSIEDLQCTSINKYI